jgi:hypothetical protein
MIFGNKNLKSVIYPYVSLFIALFLMYKGVMIEL